MALEAPIAGKVAILIGGGSGHYPAFCGYVGPDLADAAAMGKIFTSPSAEQVYRCTKAVAAGLGVLYVYGSYSGDVLNFDMAAARCIAEGIDVRSVQVTDDVASAPKSNEEDRRGIAGDHGTTMLRGMRAANRAIAELDDGVSPGMVLVAAGSAFSDAAGGASGALFGLFLLTSGQKLDAGPFDVAGIQLALQAAAASVSRTGKAQVGDKTMLDALVLFVTALSQAVGQDGVEPVAAWSAAVRGGRGRGSHGRHGRPQRARRATR